MKLLRKLLAVLLFLVLAVGLYTALKAFSGMDPFNLDSDKLFSIFRSKSGDVIREAGIRGLPVPSTIASIETKKQASLKIALIADSHNDSSHLQKALEQAKKLQVDYAVGLGDYTAVGTVKELADAKKIFDQSGVRYFTIPGDHDLWANKSKAETGTKNFESVFGKPYHVLNEHGITQIFMNNANFDAGISAEQMNWLEQALIEADTTREGKPVFVFLHQPIYHPTSSHIMGRLNEAVEQQRISLLELFKKYQVAEVISGDLHFYGRYTDSSSGLSMTTVGAVTNDRNLQKPRFAMLSVFTDGSYEITDIEIN